MHCKPRCVARLSTADRTLRFDDLPDGPNVWLFVGVNGVGKTTTIGKVGAQQAALGRTVLMAAGDTFRAAAVEQLGTWAERSGAEIVRGNEGGDPERGHLRRNRTCHGSSISIWCWATPLDAFIRRRT